MTSLPPRFEVQARLGQGGFGTVYQAWDRERSRPVAVKVLERQTGESLRRFKNEFRGLADIAHPNLISLYDLISDGETWLFTMELLADAVPFVQWVRPPSEGLQEGRLRDGLRQLTEGLLTLHGTGRLHRDIKPGNVLVTSEGRVVLLDFGLLAQTDDEGRCESQSIVGTWEYVAPEQGLGDQVTLAADWYSVGIMLYQALTGFLPFTGDFFALLNLKQKPLPAAAIVALAGCPQDLVVLCLALMSPRPVERPLGSDLLRQFGGATLPAAASRASVLVGRGPQLAELRTAFDEAATRGITVGLHGPSGMGKTALVTQFLDEVGASHPQAVILPGRCYEQEEVPYKAFDAIVDALGRRLCGLDPREVDALLPLDILAVTRIFPVLMEVPAIAQGRHREVDGGDRPALRRRACSALRELFTRLAMKRRVVMLIDDLQWTDEESLFLLHELLSPPDPPPMLMVVAWRDEELKPGTLLWQLVHPAKGQPLGQDVRLVEVPVLLPDEATVLARRLLGEDSPALLGLVREAGGHPYLLSELVLAHTRLVDRTDVLTLDAALSSRIDCLPAASRRVLEVLAVAGRPLLREDALHAAGVAAEETDILGVLRAQHLIRSVGSSASIATYHDRIRESVAYRLDAETARRHHGALAEALRTRPGTEAETLVGHYLQAGDLENAARHAPAAAAQAEAAMAFDRAARLYALALKLHASDRVEAFALRIKLADALLAAGRGAEAARCYREAAAEADPETAVDLTRRSAHEYLCSGLIDEGLEALEAVVRPQRLHLAPSGQAALPGFILRRAFLTVRGTGYRERAAAEVSAAELARVDTCWSAVVGLSMVDTMRAAEMQTRHAWLALRCGEPMRVARALAWEVAFCSGFKGSDRMVQALEVSCRGLLDRLQIPELNGRAAHTLGLGIFLVGHFARAVTQFDTALELLRPCTGVSWAVNSSHMFRFVSAWYLGRLDLLSQGFEEQLRICRTQGDQYAVVNLMTRLSWILALMADRPDTAAEGLRHVMDHWSEQAYHLSHWYRWLGRSEICIYSGQAAEAWQEVQAGWRAYQSSALPYLQICHIVSLDLRARAALLQARQSGGAVRQSWLRSAERDAGRIERERRDFGRALAAVIRTGVAAGRDDTGRTLEALQTAETQVRQADLGLYATTLRYRRGQLQGGEEGAALQAEALDALGQLAVVKPETMVALLTPGPWPD